MKLHVIVRAAGERTSDACVRELERQTSPAAVERVELTPFWRTLRAGLEHGRHSGADWVLSVDADVLPSQQAVSMAMAWAAKAGDRDAVLSGMIQDKFTATVRFGGIRLYRAATIPLVLEVMPGLGETVRPESTAIKKLAERGWRHHLVSELAGLHDYEQYYRDIYRKAFLHMQKHGARMARFLDLWMSLADRDPDYQAALAGAADAMLDRRAVDCDAGHAAFQERESLARIGLVEKPAMDGAGLDYQAEIDRLQAALDRGEIAPVSPDEQADYERARSEADALASLGRLGDSLKRLAALSPALKNAAIHQVRRAIPDSDLLRTFSFREWLRARTNRG